MVKKLIKKPVFYMTLIILILIVSRHFLNARKAFYMPDYPYSAITDGKDIFKYTGLSPSGAEEMIKAGREDDVKKLNRLYFEKPGIKKQYILFPVTAEDKITSDLPPLAPVKKGDILVSFSTYTLDWRHGHIALALTDGGEMCLEHISAGKKSVITKGKKWNRYSNFVLLRYPDEKTAAMAANYALSKLEGVPYSIFAGIKVKDKSGYEKADSSHCSHIVWQAYKAVGADLDSNGGRLVTPHDIAMSPKLKTVQIYGVNPQEYKDRILTQ